MYHGRLDEVYHPLPDMSTVGLLGRVGAGATGRPPLLSLVRGPPVALVWLQPIVHLLGVLPAFHVATHVACPL